MRLFDTQRLLVGGTIGVAVAGLAVWLATFSGELTAVVVVLGIALVGLGLGAAAATCTYVVASLLVLGLAPSPREMDAGDVMRVVVLVLGSPLIILMSVLAERRRWEKDQALRQATESRGQSQVEREAAAEARLELRGALELVERERARLEEVAGAVPEPLIVYDAEGRGRYANRAALRLLGRSFYDRLPDDWARAAEPRDERGRPLGEEDWPQVRGRREAFRGRMTVRLPMSARDLLVDVEGTPLPDGGCVLLLRDVGREVDERRRLSRFASFVAHELRNPLAVAKARMELAGRELSLPTRAAGHGARALESVDAAIGILERLELFTRAEAGRLEAEMQPFDLRAATEAAVERLRARGSTREVQLSVRGPAEVVGDRPLTEQAITNLLTNADRYSTADAPIEIEIGGGSAPVLRVRDQGPGIPDELGETLFRERVSSGRGLGLGLYLVNAAMEAQGGSVELEERTPRAVFVLRWAAVAAPGPAEADPGEVAGA